ncbi:MAG: biopolymer transporter ExbD [Verrucomicrobiales bacterium]|jgi:biopolymer transport protein ExbD|nr:biopolymer transporter ExbD [Verrucomicrobiales bacterium]
MARKPLPSEPDPILDMSPMIDMSFLLLIYFLVTSTLEPTEADLAMTMPSSMSDGSSKVEIDMMTIQVNAAGHVVLNDEVLDTDAATRDVPMLMDRLRTYVESARLTESEPMVIIAADDASKGQRFVDILNALADPTVDISKVTITGFSEDK